MIEILHKTTRVILLQVESSTLAGADLQRAMLNGADLRGFDLSGANLAYARLTHADLRGADLSGAWLWQANLLNADLAGADLRDTMLLGVVLWGTNLSDILWDAGTQWPYDFRLSDLPGSEGDCGSKGCEVEAPGVDAVVCRKGLHRVSPDWGACPTCLQTLWWNSDRARRRAAKARARSAALQACVSKNAQKFGVALARFEPPATWTDS